MKYTDTEYMVDLPSDPDYCGISKVVLTRRESIHVKHIFTEVFTRKSIDIQPMLDYIGWDLMKYMEYMTHRIRKIYHFPRDLNMDANKLKRKSNQVFPEIEKLSNTKQIIILDLDGTITHRNFKKLELLDRCQTTCKTIVCSANPDAKNIIRKKYSPDMQVNACAGKKEKILKLIEIAKKYDFVHFVDNEDCYLQYAWLFDIMSYKWNGRKIKPFTMKTK